MVTMAGSAGDDAAAAARSAQAQDLIDQAQSEDVLLDVLSAWELCVLGGPRQVLFDEAPARAWAGLRRGARSKLPPVILDGLERRGLLIRQAPPGAPGADHDPGLAGYSFAPRLGLVMAARSRPTLAVTCELENVPSRYPRFFGLGDEQDPLRALVFEAPTPAPEGDLPYTKKAGPLGWFYRYDLVAAQSAADFLARWALLRSREHPNASRIITLLRHDRGQLLTVQAVAVRSDDGRSARVNGGGEHDQAGLTSIMSELLRPVR